MSELGGPVHAPSLHISDFPPVYALGHVADTRAYLSGPGCRERLTDVVSAAVSSGCPDEQRPDGLFGINLDYNCFDPGYSMPGSPIAWGFPFHSSCWDLFSRALSPEPPERSRDPRKYDCWQGSMIQTLFDLCRACPVQGSAMNWGHDYQLDARRPAFQEHWYPGTDSPSEPENRVPSLGPPDESSDPLDVPPLTRIFERPTLLALDNSGISVPGPNEAVRTRLDTRRDIFSRLPTEIRASILESLPSQDACRLRLASFVFATMSLSDSFWKSRFVRHALSHIPEARHFLSSPDHRGRWKTIYAFIRAIETMPAMENRRRVWSLALALADLLTAVRDLSCRGISIQSYFEPEALPDNDSLHGDWVTASRCLQTEIEVLANGSRSMRERKIAIPDIAIVAIHVSMTSELSGALPPL